MKNSEIDNAILAVVEVRWQKVAMVVARTMDTPAVEFPEGDAGFELIAKRVRALVRDGRLVSQGDVKKPRHSEVRLP